MENNKRRIDIPKVSSTKELIKLYNSKIEEKEYDLLSRQYYLIGYVKDISKYVLAVLLEKGPTDEAGKAIIEEGNVLESSFENPITWSSIILSKYQIFEINSPKIQFKIKDYWFSSPDFKQTAENRYTIDLVNHTVIEEELLLNK